MRVVLLLLALLCGSAHAQIFTLPTCIPKTVWTPFGTGTDWVRGQEQVTPADPIVSWRAWWCPSASGVWTSYVHLSVERPEWTLNKIDTELTTVFRSADRITALKNTLSVYSVAPTTLERPSWNMAAASAGLALASIKPGPPPADVWQVPASGSSLYNSANGKLVAKINGQSAPPYTVCSCSSAILVGASTYCPLSGGILTVVALCKKVVP